MAAKGKHVIFLGPNEKVSPQILEAPAENAGLLPGMLIGLNASGNFIPNATADAKAAPIIAQENYLEQKTTDDAYTDGDTVYGIQVRDGEYVNVLVNAGNNITAMNTPLTSNGDGTFKIGNANLSDAIFLSAEIINVTGSDALVRAKKLVS